MMQTSFGLPGLVRFLVDAISHRDYAVEPSTTPRRPGACWQQYYVYLFSQMITGFWQLYVKNYAPNQSFDYGSPAAVLWLER